MVVNCESISVSRIDCLSGIRLVQLGDFPGSAKSSYARFILTSPEAAAEYPGTPAQITIGTMNGTPSIRSSIRLAHSDGSITISSSSSITFNQGGSKINLPNKAGTIALLDDVQEAKSELYLFDFDITFAGGERRGQCTGQFLHDSLDLYTEGLNSINSSTSFDIFVSHLIKSDSQIATGKMIKNDASTYAFITSIAYDNEKGFGFIGYEGVTNISPIAIYKNQDNINTAACRCFVTKILG